MKIGIWCDYSFTLGPSEGIGVFVDNLARGMLQADPECELVMKCNHRDWRVMQPLVDAGAGRVQVDCGWRPSFVERKLAKVARKLARLTSGHQEQRATGWVQNLFGKVHEIFTARQISKQTTTIDRCDVWLVPYVGLDMEFSKPYVVVVHDLVCYHFPEMMSPSKLREFMGIARRIVDRSTLVACMGNFIRDNDIRGVLGVDEDRIRVIKPAVPKDILEIDPDAPAATLSEIDSRLRAGRYLFYPSAFRTYKNHELLVEALGALHNRGEQDWQVVFTGIRSCPARISDMARRLGVEESVLCLGKVSRDHLYSLYKSAFATVVPSRYEQGSFPIMEAIACGCPAIASDIPSLREQFAEMGEAMLYFNPDSVPELLKRLATVVIAPREFADKQRSSFDGMCQDGWESAGRKWLKVLKDVIKDSRASMREASNAQPWMSNRSGAA
ncbi:glycosyltransferase family 4 protein [Pirellulaceae bacterium SH501]